MKNTFATLVMRVVPTAIGCLCLVLTGGCLLALIPEKYFTNQAALGVRHDAQTNVVERLVMKKWFVVRGSVICEPSRSVCYRTRVYLERTNVPSVRYRSLEKLCGDDPTGQNWFSPDWNFRPLSGTNLWVAVQGLAQQYGRFWITNGWEKDIDFRVYLLSPKAVLTEKELQTFAPRERLGFPEIIFDSVNHRLTYRTRHGYETYSLLEDAIQRCSEPPQAEALLPRDFGFEDTSELSKHFGTNCYIIVKGPLDSYSRRTNEFVIRVYTDYSGKPHYQQTVATTNFADLKRVQISDGTGVVTYKSQDDDFTYYPSENTLKKEVKAELSKP